MRRCRVVAVLLLGIAFIGILSRLFATVSWTATYIADWRVVVKDVVGSPVTNACMVFIDEEGEEYYPLPHGDRDKSRFCTDSGGVIQVEISFNYGGTYWLLFWIIPVGAPQNMNAEPDQGWHAVLNAPGYKASSAILNSSTKEVVVRMTVLGERGQSKAR
jgi:hypothetical protein